MHRNTNVPNSRSRLLIAACVTALVVFGGSPAGAAADSLKSDAKKAGRAVGSTTRDIGHNTKKAGKEIGRGARDAGKAIGSAAREGGREFRRALKGE